MLPDEVLIKVGACGINNTDIWVRESAYGASQGTRRDFATVRDYALSETIKPLVAGTFALDDLGRAQEEFKKKEFVGKLVIDVSGT